MIKKILLCLLCLCLVLSGCGDGSAKPASSGALEASSLPESSSQVSAAPGTESAPDVSGVWENRGDGKEQYVIPEFSRRGEDGSLLSPGVFRDSLGTEFPDMPENPRTVSLYGSYAEAWQLAGGELIGVTKDALEERDLGLPGDIPVVGTVKEPNAEAIIALEPELVLLNPDIAGQTDIKDVLENAGLSCAYFRVDTFEDYSSMMFQFWGLTGREDLYEKNVEAVGEQIQEAKVTAALSSNLPNVLLMRAFSTGIKAKTDDELAGSILKDLNARNIADEHPSMLEDLSLEEIITADPDFIFVTTMGSEEKALQYLDSLIEKNPAWQELTAVKEGRYIVLPKDLFHYKPNNRWGESYEYLGKILYPDLFEGEWQRKAADEGQGQQETAVASVAGDF